jgi:hypothetical protein
VSKGRLTSVQMAVEVNHRDRTVSAVDRPQKRQCNSMVSAEGDDARQGFSLDRGSPFVSVCCGSAGENLIVAFLDLRKCPCVVVS